MDRRPVAAGTFYPGEAESLRALVQGLKAVERARTRPVAVMAPHAGYIYSGAVAKSVFSNIDIAPVAVILCPCHVMAASAIGVWPDGRWRTPLGAVPVDEETAEHLLETVPGLTRDYHSHLEEHSLEVLLPFLQIYASRTAIVPISIAIDETEALIALGEGLAAALKGRDVLVVASSDMTHYEEAGVAERKDKLALDKLLALDAEGMASVVSANDISMCGVAPATVMTAYAVQAGATSAQLVHYTSSGEASGDYSQVVGYAGVIIE